MSISSSAPAGRGSSLTWLILMSAFFLSGIAGLIYESIWTHYLKLYLGHASYAQVLVLAAFLTGMAGGAWLASRLSLSGRNLLRSYALVEVVIGLLGLAFHQSFVGLEQWSFDVVIPQLSAPASIFAFKWALALLIVTPQSVLLGMTFPLMVGGVLRMFTRHGGRTIASFYFVNSLGASIGVWLSGFYLIGAAGLPGTVLMAAMLNLLVGLVVFAVVRGPGGQGSSVNPDRVRKVATGDHAQLLLLCAFGTGFASFIYEISWIRMLNLVLGTTTHAFELMLGTFIMGMAIGSLAIRRYLDKLQCPLRFLGLVQLFMALAAGATMVLYNELFSWMELLLRGLSTTVEGYAMFNIISLGICVVVMLPATICAGMTLPLITHTLRSEQGGEAVVGRVYAVNTLGSIAGVALVSAVLIPVFGLKWALFCGVLADLGLGALLLYQGGWHALLRPLPLALGIPVLLIGPFAEFEPGRMMSGVYSRGQPASQDEVKVVYYRDGPTASVGVKQFSPGQYTVLTNGKPDAGLRLYDLPASVDETTMILLGAMPLAVAPGARDVAVVGFGSGVTTQTLLLSPYLERVDTIEIEPRMIDAARTFAPRVARVFDDPRSHLHVEDAKSFFSTSGRRYDIIISEPSNPWVSGVAGLFSTEYYKGLKRYLNPDGVLAQWIHIYSFDNVLLASIMKALGENFQHYNIYQLNTGDVLVLASQAAIASPTDAIFRMPDMAADLTRIGVHTLADLDVRFLSGDNILQPWLASLSVPPNSDYFPLVDLGAVRARFLESKADLLDYAHSAQILLHPADWRSALAAASINHLPKDIPMAVETLSMEQHLLREPASETLDMLESGSGAFAALLRIEALLDRCELHAQPQRYIKNALLLARQINTYARSDVWIEFWGKHLAADCAATASPQTREFIRFLQVVAAGDDAVISGLGRRVLANAGAAERGYVLRNVIAADLRMNQRAQARALWEQEGAQNSDLVLQMLALGMGEP